MGPDPTPRSPVGLSPAGLILGAWLIATPALGQAPGWHYSPLPGEGDRATLGCDREATPDQFTCLAVRCEDDFSTGVHVYSSRGPVAGTWEMTLDRENARFVAVAAQPYGGRFLEDAELLLDRIAQGTFIYLRRADDPGSFAYIDLGGSLFAINGALAWCAPRVPADEPNAGTDVIR